MITLNIDYHIRRATVKALNKNKCFTTAAKDLGVVSRRVVERLIRQYGIIYDYNNKHYK